MRKRLATQQGRNSAGLNLQILNFILNYDIKYRMGPARPAGTRTDGGPVG